MRVGWCLPLVASAALGCERANPIREAVASAASAPAPAAPSALVLTPPAEDAGALAYGCREQSPQAFLLRQSYLVKPGASAEEQRQRLAARYHSVSYRTERYGHFPGFGTYEQNPHGPRYYAAETTFFGFTLTLNRRVIPALGCVERAILRECASEPYRPHRVLGLRDHNTYRDYEISNHVYGIAVDVDPDTNTCCGCVPPWNQHPLCRDKSLSVQQRMSIPECGVRQFERFGFYWLGHDELEDTMHFEFLGDPDRITA